MTTGPIPKRSEQRRRVNTPVVPIDGAPGAPVVVAPDPDESWHPLARAWYDSLGQSGQARFYEPSDWATALLLAESMSRDLRPQVVGVTEAGRVVTEVIPLKGASLSAYLKGFGLLLVTEGDRRRMRLELARPVTDEEAEHASATVTSLQSRLGG